MSLYSRPTRDCTAQKWYSLSRLGDTINKTQVHEAADTYWKEYLASDSHKAMLHIAADYELANMIHIAQSNSRHRLPVAYVTNGTVFHPHGEIWQSYNETRGSVQLHASAPSIQRYIYAEEMQKRDEGTVRCGNDLMNVGLQNDDDICICGQSDVAGDPDVMFHGVDMYGGQDGYNAVHYAALRRAARPRHGVSQLSGDGPLPPSQQPAGRHRLTRLAVLGQLPRRPGAVLERGERQGRVSNVWAAGQRLSGAVNPM